MTRRPIVLLALAALACPTHAQEAPSAALGRALDADARDQLDAARALYAEVAAAGGPLARHADLRQVWLQVVAGAGGAPRPLSAEGVGDDLQQAALTARATREQAAREGDRLGEVMARRVGAVVELASVLRDLEAIAATEAGAASSRAALEAEVIKAMGELRAAEDAATASRVETATRHLRDALLALEELCRQDLMALGTEREGRPWRVARHEATRRVMAVLQRRQEAGSPVQDELTSWTRAVEEARSSMAWAGLSDALEVLLGKKSLRAPAAWPHEAGYRAALEDLAFGRDELEKRLRVARAAWDLEQLTLVRVTAAELTAQGARELLAPGVLRQGADAALALAATRAAWREVAAARDRDLVRDLLELEARRAALAPPPAR